MFVRRVTAVVHALWVLLLTKVWYDNRADDLTKEGMLKGIEGAAAFVLFLSQVSGLRASTVAQIARYDF